MKILKSIFAVAVAAALSLTACNGNGSDSDSKDGDKEKKAVSTEAVDKTDSAEAVDDESEPDSDVDLTNLTADYTVVDFNAEWCGPCKQFAPIFEAAAEKYDNMDFVSIDIDQYPEIAEEYGVQAIPMVIILDRDGNVINQNVGYMDADQFEAFLTVE